MGLDRIVLPNIALHMDAPSPSRLLHGNSRAGLRRAGKRGR